MSFKMYESHWTKLAMFLDVEKTLKTLKNKLNKLYQ
jgi:hypothetical protein